MHICIHSSLGVGGQSQRSINTWAWSAEGRRTPRCLPVVQTYPISDSHTHSLFSSFLSPSPFYLTFILNPLPVTHTYPLSLPRPPIHTHTSIDWHTLGTSGWSARQERALLFSLHHTPRRIDIVSAQERRSGIWNRYYIYIYIYIYTHICMYIGGSV